MPSPTIQHFVGIAGSGMSAIAQVLAAEGLPVQGSDRSFDREELPETRAILEAQGIRIVPQDGSGITEQVLRVVASTAIEAAIPDLVAARELGVPIVHRSDALAGLVNSRLGVAVAGTSGKSTITAMTGVILAAAGLDPAVINGGKIVNFASERALGNARPGSGPVVIEADESDGTLERYTPEWGLLANLSLDHKPLPELEQLFREFSRRVRQSLVVGVDCPHLRRLLPEFPRSISYGLHESADFRAEGVRALAWGSRFTLHGHELEIRVPGLHNVQNASGAAALARSLGASWEQVREGLAAYAGVRRRLEVLGVREGVTIIDDYAHNPEKVAASLATLVAAFPRVLVLFQWHGFGPAKLLGGEMAAAIAGALRQGDELLLPPVFYAGGTVNREFSLEDWAEQLRRSGVAARSFDSRPASAEAAWASASPGAALVVMGARDETLSTVASGLLAG